MRRQYIGITDFTDDLQSWAMLDVLLRSTKKDRMLMVGLMMSRKTLNGLPSKWSTVFPSNQSISKIFIAHHSAYNTLHYADYDGIDVLRNLKRAAFFGGKKMDAMQLDMVWPDVVAVRVFRDAYPDVELVLQVNSVALTQCDDDPKKVLDRLSAYRDAVDYVLLDKSMGRGKGMDASALLPFVRILRERRPDLGIAVAGGLGPETIHLAEPVIREFPEVSIDAQGRLRPSGSALDPIDWDIAEEYILRATEVMDRY